MMLREKRMQIPHRLLVWTPVILALIAGVCGYGKLLADVGNIERRVTEHELAQDAEWRRDLEILRQLAEVKRDVGWVRDLLEARYGSDWRDRYDRK